MDFPWRPRFWHTPRLGWAEVRQTCRLLAAFGLAGGSAVLLGVPEWYWAIITAVVVMQPDWDHTVAAGRDRIVATLIGALVGLGLIALHEQGAGLIPLAVAGLVPLAGLAAIWPNLRLACTTLVVVLLIPAAGDPYGRPLLRIADILLGVLACLAVSRLVFPVDPKAPGS